MKNIDWYEIGEVKMEVNEEKLEKKFKIGDKKILVIVVLVAVVVAVLAIMITKNSKDRLTISTKSTLEKIIEISDLSTIEYTYNAIVTKYDEDKPKEVEYYVSYEGIVEAGIDFNEVKIEIDDKSKVISITLPPAKVNRTIVDMGTLDYIHVKESDESVGVSQEAYKLCLKDLQDRANEEDEILESAKDNAKSAIEALLKPWIDSVDGVFTVEID